MKTMRLLAKYYDKQSLITQRAKDGAINFALSSLYNIYILINKNKINILIFFTVMIIFRIIDNILYLIIIGG